MFKRLVGYGTAVATGVATVTAIEKAVGDVPAWLAFLAGVAVVAFGMVQTSIRIEYSRDRYRGRHARETEEWSEDGRES